jgi:hypothetical protein
MRKQQCGQRVGGGVGMAGVGWQAVGWQAVGWQGVGGGGLGSHRKNLRWDTLAMTSLSRLENSLRLGCNTRRAGRSTRPLVLSPTPVNMSNPER